MLGQNNGARRLQLVVPALLVLWFLSFLAACGSPSQSAALTGDAIRVETPVIRPAGAGQNSAAYLTVVNPTAQDDRLLSVSGDIAAAIEIHETTNDNGVMRMHPHGDGFPLPAGSILDLKPGGKHVMLMNLTEPLVSGQQITLTLTFEKAGQIDVAIPVLAQQ